MLSGVSKEDALEALKHMMGLYSVSYIVIKTKFTVHHLEKLSRSVKDRGRWKWIGETSSLAFSEPLQDEEVYRSNIDGGDLFPRLYFLDSSFINEFREWLNMRNLEITALEAPKI